MKCFTISHQIEIEPGTCVSIQEILRHQRTLKCDDSSLHDKLLETDFVKDLGSYNSFLWEPYQPKDDELFLKAQSMSSIEEIKKLHEELNHEKESSLESILNENSPKQKNIRICKNTYTNQILNKKKQIFEPYVEIPEVNSK